MGISFRDNNAKGHRRRVEKTAKPQYGSQGEAEVVAGYLLSEVLQAWCAMWVRERPTDAYERLDSDEAAATHSGNRLANAGRSFYGPVQWLSEWTGINRRRVTGICNGEFVTVPFSQAEKLLRAIDKEYMLDNGMIPVVPNPNWSNEKWFAYMRERGCV